MTDPEELATILVVGSLFLLLLAAFHGWRKKREEAKEYKTKYEKALHHRKSAEVRLGKLAEHLAPFVKAWPWDPKNFRFLGSPVDGIQFNKDGIVFVEIKTGGARLSKSQKDFRDLVEAGKVSFVTFKITEDGTKMVQKGVEL